ncbi:MAG: Sec-independent protein translocase protein TatB [Gammaproteobacteria bacterium]|nr:Sec-independent protein translocase protein TatB [Gammaproteobacteria bacterium]
MFDVGFWEILLIMILALVVLGPERLPKAAQTVGYWIGKGRRYVEGVKAQVEQEFDSGELKRILHNQEIQIKELQGKLGDTENHINHEYHSLFANSDDPGTDTETGDTEAQPRYEILEEDTEDYETDFSKEKSGSGQPVDKMATTDKPE